MFKAKLHWGVLCCVVSAACSGAYEEELFDEARTIEQPIWRGLNDGDDPWSSATVRVRVPAVGESGFYGCTGTALTRRLVLTGNHCLQRAVDGLGNFLSGPRDPAGALVDVGAGPAIAETRGIVGWASPLSGPTNISDPTEIRRDIAVLVLDAPLSENRVYPQRPPDDFVVTDPDVNRLGLQDVTVSMPASAVGWGRTQSGETTIRQIQTWTFMEQASPREGHQPFAFGRQIDAVFLQGYRGTDAGDSGGPLYRLLDERNLRLREQVGVAASRMVGDHPDVPGSRSTWASLVDVVGTNHVWIAQFAAGEAYDIANVARVSGRWFGETDYRGPCRADVDANCDRIIDDPVHCPMVFQEGTRVLNPPNINSTGTNVVVFGARSVKINDRGVLRNRDGGFSDVVAGGTWPLGHVALGTDVRAEVVYAEGRVTASHRTVVQGAMASAFGGHVSVPEIRGVTRAPQFALTAAFPSSQQDLHLEPGSVSTLTTSATRRHVSIKSHGRLRLVAGPSGGVFRFHSLEIHPQGVLEIDGSVVVYVRDTFIHRGTIDEAQSHLLLGYFGTETAHVESSFSGTLVAPRAGIVLASRNHRGAFYGDWVELHQGGEIRHRPYRCR